MYINDLCCCMYAQNNMNSWQHVFIGQQTFWHFIVRKAHVLWHNGSLIFRGCSCPSSVTLNNKNIRALKLKQLNGIQPSFILLFTSVPSCRDIKMSSIKDCLYVIFTHLHVIFKLHLKCLKLARPLLYVFLNCGLHPKCFKQKFVIFFPGKSSLASGLVLH